MLGLILFFFNSLKEERNQGGMEKNVLNSLEEEKNEGGRKINAVGKLNCRVIFKFYYILCHIIDKVYIFYATTLMNRIIGDIFDMPNICNVQGCLISIFYL